MISMPVGFRYQIPQQMPKLFIGIVRTTVESMFTDVLKGSFWKDRSQSNDNEIEVLRNLFIQCVGIGQKQRRTVAVKNAGRTVAGCGDPSHCDGCQYGDKRLHCVGPFRFAQGKSALPPAPKQGWLS